MARAGIVEIRDRFAGVTDPRVERTKRHKLLDMIVIALCGAIAGADGWADVERFGKAKLDWFRRFLELPHGPASHDTFGRVFTQLDTDEFLTCLHNWMRSLQLTLKQKSKTGELAVAIDGKTLRRSFDTATGKSALHVVSAWAGDLRICLGQVAVEEKSNEITAVPKLLELLELTGAVVTLDAMHCQKETAAAIRRQGADYILTVKKNQPTLYNNLCDLFLGMETTTIGCRACASTKRSGAATAASNDARFTSAPRPTNSRPAGNGQTSRRWEWFIAIAKSETRSTRRQHSLSAACRRA